MTPVPQNLGFEEPGGAPGHAAGWVLVETPKAREFAGFAVETFTPPDDPLMYGWTVMNGPALAFGAAPPYDPLTTGDPPLYLQDNASLGPHGLQDPDTFALEPGGSYTFGVYVRSSSQFILGPAVQLTASGGVGAVFDVLSAEVLRAGGFGPVPLDETVLESASAELVVLPDAGAPWYRLSVSFRIPEDAAEPFLATATRAVFLFADGDGTVPYAGPSAGGVNLWGAFMYRGALSPAEGFEGAWGGNEAFLYQLAFPGGATSAVFPAEQPGETTPWDGFDRWTVPYHFDLTGVAESAAWGGPLPEESFEASWSNDSWAGELTAPTAVSWGGGLPAEGFESGWLNDSWTDEIGVLGSLALLSDDLGDEVETFERAHPDTEVTADPATDKLVAAGHAVPADLRVHVVVEGGVPGNSYPAPLVKQLFYFAVSVAANDFKLSLTSGGAAVDLTSAGTGTIVVRADPRRYWDGPNLNPTL